MECYRLSVIHIITLQLCTACLACHTSATYSSHLSVAFVERHFTGGVGSATGVGIRTLHGKGCSRNYPQGVGGPQTLFCPVGGGCFVDNVSEGWGVEG